MDEKIDVRKYVIDGRRNNLERTFRSVYELGEKVGREVSNSWERDVLLVSVLAYLAIC